ncbi:MAG: hypothetical protein V4447_12975 [Pseudomonadota bacterium]
MAILLRRLFHVPRLTLMFTAYNTKYSTHELILSHGSDGVDRLSQSLLDAGVDLNPQEEKND